MKRYLRESIVNDLARGKRVALVASTRSVAVDAFNELAESDVPWTLVKRVNGAERLELGPGVLHVLTPRGGGVRGLVLDVAIILDGLRPLDGTQMREDFLGDLHVAGVTRPDGIELVFCE